MQPMRYSHPGPAVRAQDTRRSRPFPPVPISVRVLSVLDEASSSGPADTRQDAQRSKHLCTPSLGHRLWVHPRARLFLVGFLLFGVLTGVALAAFGLRNHLGH